MINDNSLLLLLFAAGRRAGVERFGYAVESSMIARNTVTWNRANTSS
jgi:hypothetical protein